MLLLYDYLVKSPAFIIQNRFCYKLIFLSFLLQKISSTVRLVDSNPEDIKIEYKATNCQ